MCVFSQANPSPPFAQPSPQQAAAFGFSDPDVDEDAMDWEEAPSACSWTPTSGSAGSDTLMFCHTLQFVSCAFLFLFLTLSSSLFSLLAGKFHQVIHQPRLCFISFFSCAG